MNLQGANGNITSPNGLLPFPGMGLSGRNEGLMPSPADPSTEDISNFLRAVQLNDQLMNGGGPSPVPGGQDLNANSMFNRVSSATSLQQLAQQQQQQQQQTIKLAGGPDLGHHFDAGLLGHSGGGYLQGPDPGALDPSLLQTGPISAAQAQSIDPAFHYQLPTSPPLQGQNPPMGMGMGMQGGPYGNGAVPPHMQPPQQHHQPYGTSPNGMNGGPAGPMPPLPPGAPQSLVQSPEYQAAYRAALNVALSQQQNSMNVGAGQQMGGPRGPPTAAMNMQPNNAAFYGNGSSPNQQALLAAAAGGPGSMAYSPDSLTAALMQNAAAVQRTHHQLNAAAGQVSPQQLLARGMGNGHPGQRTPHHPHTPSNLGMQPPTTVGMPPMLGNAGINPALLNMNAAANLAHLNAAALGLAGDPTRGLVRGSYGSAVNVAVPRTDSYGNLSNPRFPRDHMRSNSHSHLSSGLRSGPSSSGNLLALQTDPSDVLPTINRGLPSTGSFSTLTDLVNYKYQNLEEVIGLVKETAQDQNGCRFLQKKLDEGGPEAVDTVLDETLEAAHELMVDPFANYMIQKLLDICSEAQRLKLIKTVEDRLITIALNTHGTRAVQKLVETMKDPEQIEMVSRALSPGALLLIKDLNGNHVIQKILQKLQPEQKQFVYDTVCNNILEVASHSRHGCCVLQRCLDFASPSQRERLVDVVGASALELSQDPFGNYVVQYALGMGDTTISSKIAHRLKGNMVELSLQKFSSNVVEKFLKPSEGILPIHREAIIREIIQSPLLARLLNDSYGNYVMQSALTVTADTPQLHAELVDALRPYLPLLRGCLHGRRIISKMNLKF